MIKKKSEFERFDEVMHKLISVSHEDIKAKLDAERTAKKKRKPKASASRVTRAKD